MTSKLSWIAFLPFTLMAIAIKVIQLSFLDANGTFMGINNLTLSYIAIACALVILLLAFIFCAIDKKTAQVYLLNRNIFAGIVGLLFSIVLACDGANKAFVAMKTLEFSALDIANIVLTILCAIVFVVLGLNHFVGNGGVRGLSVFYLIPSLWAALKLVSCFLEFTTVSIAVTDVTVLVCYIFITLFLFNYAMIVSLLHGKSPVKATFIYGMPAVTMLLSYSVYELANIIRAGAMADIFSNVEVVELALLGIYILAFVIEVTACVCTKDEIELVDEVDEDYNEIDDPDMEVTQVLKESVKRDESSEPLSIKTDLYDENHLSIDDQLLIEVAQNSLEQSEQLNDMDTSDFIYGAVPSDDEFILPVENDEQKAPDYVQEQVEEDTNFYITKEDSTYSLEDEALEEDAEKSLDRIDKLILEISEDDN